MKMSILTFTLVSALVPALAGPVLAQQTADDVAWIRRCVADNKDEGQAAPVILTYCTCMNDKMSSGETRSITAWEKANPRAMEACATQAGWRGK